MGADEIDGWQEILQGAAEEAQAPSPAAPVRAGTVESVPFDYQNQVGEVQRRLKMAALYDVVLSNSLFDADGGELVAEVEAEFRAFAMQRQAALLGVAAPAPQPTVEAQFSPEQAEILAMVCDLGSQGVSVLHALANTMLAKARASGTPLPSPAVQARPVKPAKLGLRQNRVPPSMRTPAAAPPVKAPPPPQAAKKLPVRQIVPAAVPESVSDIPIEDSEYVENGEKYTAKWVDISADDYGPEEQPKIQALRPGQATRLPIGVRVFNLDGQFKKLVGKRKSGQRKGRGGLPFPASSSMPLLTAAATGVANSVAQSGDRGMQVAVRASLGS